MSNTMSNTMPNTIKQNNKFITFPITDLLMDLCFDKQTTTQEGFWDIVALICMPCSLFADCIIACPRYTHYNYHLNKNEKIIIIQPTL